MMLCKFCPDCRTYSQENNGDKSFCPYCGAKLLKNYEEEFTRDIVSYEPAIIRRPTTDVKILKLYFGSDQYVNVSDEKKERKIPNKRRI